MCSVAASIFTGTWPFSHGVRANAGHVLADRNITLAEILRREGYQTRAEVAAPVLSVETGITQGFDSVRNADARGVKLTFLPFVLKACAAVLREFPQFNASLDHTGENLILKRYYNLGVAVDTENGLIVPVVRDADKKGLYEIAAELMEISEKARTRKLRPGDLRRSEWLWRRLLWVIASTSRETTSLGDDGFEEIEDDGD